jgi:predicted phage terminase large subunit-like protein
MRVKDRTALLKWDSFKKNLIKSTSVDSNENALDKQKRIAHLLSDFEAFCTYYFPQYTTSPFAQFHKRFAKKTVENNRIFITRAWSRDHAKSVTSGVMLPLFLKMKGELKNMLLVSYSEDNAIELLRPLKIQLESNQRLINDFGIQKGRGNWEDGKFITADGCSFRAIGSGQNPRGSRNEEARPDYILCDDIDDDELCRNPKRLDNAWDWLIGALFGCLSIEGAKRFIIVGNIIAKDSLVKRSINVADDFEQINILDKQGQPSWKERFSLQECQYMISKMGYRLSQREYFNNPISEGKVFKKKDIVFGKVPDIAKMPFKVAYLDPGFKKTNASDTKAWILAGIRDGKYYIIKAFCGQASITEMIEWGYEIDAYLKRKNTTARFVMEEVFLQDLLYSDFKDYGKKKYPLSLTGDKRKKPDKDSRIESISGHFERGNVVFNEDEENNPHMKELVEQFLNFEPGVKTKKDGPDATEGAFYILNENLKFNHDILIGSKSINKHKL